MLVALPARAAVSRAEFDAQMQSTMTRLNAEAVGVDGIALLGQLVQNEYGTPAEEMQWAVDHDLSWGAIAAFAYVRATTGQSFSELEKYAIERDFWGYVEQAGMSPDKMANSLDQFLKRVQKERNTRIFERVRSDRRVLRMPDIGTGFGLLQETLDFRRLESPRPTKVHTTGGDLLKGEK